MANWALSGTKPHVAAAGQEIGAKFGVQTIYGLGSRANASDHPLGLALDIMCTNARTNPQQGDAIAAYCIANASRLGIKYIIWKQSIINVSKGDAAWRRMGNRGNDTANHNDHVHVSFLPTPGVGGPIVDTGMGAGLLGGLSSQVATVFSVDNLRRVGYVVIGFVLILMAAISITGTGKTIWNTGKQLMNYVPIGKVGKMGKVLK